MPGSIPSNLSDTCRPEAIEKWAKPLIDELCGCVRGQCNIKITDGVKSSLIEFIEQNSFCVPKCIEGSEGPFYARRLIYEDPETKFTVVAMTWGPNQSTPIHDHAGEWCVEAVALGEIEVTQYEMMEESSEFCVLEERGKIRAGKGSSGALIPPYEYHRIANNSPDKTAVTIHVYAKSLDQCGIFEPIEKNKYKKITKQLCYQPYFTANGII